MLRDPVLAQFSLLAERVAALAPVDYELPTRLPPWTVRELVAHVTRNLTALLRALDRPEPAGRSVELRDYYDKSAEVAGAVRERALADARAEVSWAGELRAAVDAARAALAGEPDERLVAVRLGSVSLGDFLITRCVEGVVHGLDLAAAVRAAPHSWVDPAAALVCAGHLAGRGARDGTPAEVTERAVHVGGVTLPVLDYIGWAAGRLPAPDPALAGIAPLIH
ncbi:hypothetical protein L083_4365 [Actinoplanes sp. N902-109]|nr:hypothetical protein L083_4365 [Actinoplanes sp. N902-109]